MMKALENAQAIYDITMNEKCEAKVQDLFSNGLHKLMVDLIEELEELQNRSCENCKHQNEGSTSFFCSKTNISFDIGGCGDYWESK